MLFKDPPSHMQIVYCRIILDPVLLTELPLKKIICISQIFLCDDDYFISDLSSVYSVDLIRFDPTDMDASLKLIFINPTYNWIIKYVNGQNTKSKISLDLSTKKVYKHKLLLLNIAVRILFVLDFGQILAYLHGSYWYSCQGLRMYLQNVYLGKKGGERGGLSWINKDS